jgi:lysylphosphatidylglycerol synthetase-like protein (DUF2156 family)
MIMAKNPFSLVSLESAQATGLLQLLRRYGSNSLAYSSLQSGMSHFLQANGYIAFVPLDRSEQEPLCLADPICSQDDMEQLLDQFISTHSYPIFVYIRKPTATILSEKGFLVNEIGTEVVIDLEQFSLSGGDKAFLRSQRNRAVKDGIFVREKPCGEVGAEVLAKLSNDWMHKKVVSCNELSFLVRPAIYTDEVDVRKFFAYREQRLVGFGAFDPIYRDGAVISYLANTLRAADEVGYSVRDLIILEALKVFKEQGKETLSLGYLPLHKVEDGEEFKHSRALKWIFRNVYEHANFIYEFKDLAFHKSRYRPGTPGCNEFKIYCAYKEPARLHLLLSILERCGINLADQLEKKLVKSVIPQSVQPGQCKVPSEQLSQSPSRRSRLA